jgi:hypothetical protein
VNPRGGRKPRYVLQFQLAVLELERARRAQEQQATAQRLTDVQARLRALEGRIKARQRALGLTAAGDADAPSSPSAPLAPAGNARRLRY